MQSDEEQTTIIYKIADYLLDLFFDIDNDDSNLYKEVENKKENNINLNKNQDEDSSNELLSEEEDINDKDNKDGLEEYLNFLI